MFKNYPKIALQVQICKFNLDIFRNYMIAGKYETNLFPTENVFGFVKENMPNSRSNFGHQRENSF